MAVLHSISVGRRRLFTQSVASLRKQSTILAIAFALIVSMPFAAQAVPPGFVDELVAGGIARPTAMAFAPDGRLFVTEQGGSVRVVKAGALRSTPFVRLTVDSQGERGLLGIAFHPNFAANRFVYLYHTVPGATAHNRITRFTARGNVALPESRTPNSRSGQSLQCQKSQRWCHPFRPGRQALCCRR